MGLIKTAVKAAVAVKVAHVVHDHIQQRQAAQFAAAQGMPATALPGQAAAAPSAPHAVDDSLTQLTKLGELRAAGVLTETEFESQKARILAG